MHPTCTTDRIREARTLARFDCLSKSDPYREGNSVWGPRQSHENDEIELADDTQRGETGDARTYPLQGKNDNFRVSPLAIHDIDSK